MTSVGPLEVWGGEVDQDVPGSAFECPAQRDELGQTPRCARGGQRVDFGSHHGFTGSS